MVPVTALHVQHWQDFDMLLFYVHCCIPRVVSFVLYLYFLFSLENDVVTT